MCGRTSLFIERSTLEERFDAEVVADGGYSPRFNIAPSEPLEVITNDAPTEIDQLHWGLIPFWEDDPGEGIINARSETAAEKNVFSEAWESRPCLVLSSGFYEWREMNSGPKQPYRIHREDDPAFAIAGLWETWGGDNEEISCVTILTTEPNELMEPIHDRMPVVLREDDEDDWLTGAPEHRAELCQPYPDDDLDAYPISTRVNDPGNDNATVIEPTETKQADFSEYT